MSKKLTLAAAIRKGIPLVAGTNYMTFRFDATGKDWASHVAHKKILLGADALGTALVGITGNVAHAIERAYEGAEKSPLKILYDLFPELIEKKRQCPTCSASQRWTTGQPPMILVGLLRHIADQHDYTREQVADFLENLK